MIISGWGRFPRVDCERSIIREPGGAAAALGAHRSVIARGNGRSYGDAALNMAGILDMRPCGRISAFDPVEGVLTCEAGMLLAELLQFLVPKGFFPPVTPGTKFVTVGGMVAADVHGKNHHGAGSFGRHVDGLELLCADGTVRHCSPIEHTDLFNATCGGMGLTGIILKVTFRLLRIATPFIRQETLRAGSLDDAMAVFESSADWTYTVGWIDCLAKGAALGRSLIYRGEHASLDETGNRVFCPRKSKRVPIDFPNWALNRLSVSAFNALYYRRGNPGLKIVDYDTYFYPLDSILEWNRIYGRAGFVQYQCVLPKAASKAGLTALLNRIAASGRGSFLAVLKLFGAGDAGFLSFPMEGYTLALDFPADTGSFNLMIELDRIVADYGGRIYLAKDARSGPDLLRHGYEHLGRFREVRRETDPGSKFTSLLSQRLDL